MTIVVIIIYINKMELNKTQQVPLTTKHALTLEQLGIKPSDNLLHPLRAGLAVKDLG